MTIEQQQDHISRRSFLVTGTATALVGAWPLRAALAMLPQRQITLYTPHNDQYLRAVYWKQGHYLPNAMTALNRFLADQHTGQICKMDPRLMDLMAALQYKLRSREPLHVLSGYRSAATNAWLVNHVDGVAHHSMHVVGKAVDISMPDQSVQSLGKVARAFDAGGVGTYPGSGFVHIDTGAVRHW